MHGVKRSKAAGKRTAGLPLQRIRLHPGLILRPLAECWRCSEQNGQAIDKQLHKPSEHDRHVLEEEVKDSLTGRPDFPKRISKSASPAVLRSVCATTGEHITIGLEPYCGQYGLPAV